MFYSIRRLLLGATILSSCLPATAGQVNWGCALFQTNKTSTDAPLDGSFHFSLGAFAGGFTPTPANVSQWAAQWREVDHAKYNPTTRAFSSAHVMTSNAAPFATNQQGYIWGYRGAIANGEWILVTNTAWKWPSATNLIDPPVNWSVSAATNVILGAVNTAPSPPTYMRTAAVGPQPLPKVEPELWRKSYFTAAELANAAISGWNADPDGDGVKNIIEYGLDKDPKSAASTWKASPELFAIAGINHLALRVERSPLSTAIFRGYASTDLNIWSNGQAIVISDTPELFFFRQSQPLSANPKNFLRLEVALP